MDNSAKAPEEKAQAQVAVGDHPSFCHHEWDLGDDPGLLEEWQQEAGMRAAFEGVNFVSPRLLVGARVDPFARDCRLDDPVSYLPPRMMADLRIRHFSLVERTPHLTHLMLTGRPENIMGMVPKGWEYSGKRTAVPVATMASVSIGWPPNTWPGVGPIETQADAERLIPPLLGVPAPVRWVWVVPKEPVNIWRLLDPTLGQPIHWIIASGGDQPAHPDVFRGLRDQCEAAGVAFWFEGNKNEDNQGLAKTVEHFGGTFGSILDGRKHRGVPSV